MTTSKSILSLKLWRSCHLNGSRRSLGYTSASIKEHQVVPLAYKVYEEYGSGVEDKSPVVILHGALGCKTNWNSLSKAISKITQRKVIAVDSRGHGESPHHPVVNYHVMSEDILHFLRTHGHSKAVLIGHSMGGRSAMAAALKQPHMVERLVSVDVSPVDNKDPHVLPKALEALLQLKLDTSLPLVKARQQADRDLADTINDITLRQFLLTNLVADDSNNGRVKWQCDLQALANNFPSIRGFPLESFEGKTYAGPTMFIGGSLSNYLRKEDFPTIRKYFTKAQFHYVVGAGHWLHSEKPQDFLQVVSTFITRLTTM